MSGAGPGRGGDERLYPAARPGWHCGGVPGDDTDPIESAMTSTAATAAAARTRTGGPDGPAVLEHVLGWTLVVVLAVLITRLGLL